MRALLPTLVLLAAGCASDPAPAPLDPEAHARVTLAGFGEASPFVAERLAAAVGWAVFPDVEDTRDACAHEGRFFERSGPAHAALLRCGARPSAPAGAAYHLLVIFEDEADVARLRAGEPLDLELAPHLMTSDLDAPDPSSSERWVVTSERGGLLWGGWDPRQSLELVVEY